MQISYRHYDRASIFSICNVKKRAVGKKKTRLHSLCDFNQLKPERSRTKKKKWNRTGTNMENYRIAFIVIVVGTIVFQFYQIKLKNPRTGYQMDMDGVHCRHIYAVDINGVYSIRAHVHFKCIESRRENSRMYLKGKIAYYIAILCVYKVGGEVVCGPNG